ncbi:MAG: DUF1800 domain-containing protein [Acidobacteria bacterium]|nr:MAG: DUF1800 domain-containing protein [Acidobacteriota bacterium]
MIRYLRLRKTTAYLVLLSVVAAIAGVNASARLAAERTDHKVLAHVLDRVTFGARSQDLERVARIGIQTYVEQQLNPQRIDDTPLEARLDRFETLDLSTREIAERYAIPAQQARKERARARAASSEPPDQQTMPAGSTRLERRGREEIQRQRLVLSELTEQKLLRAIYSERQLQEVLVDFWFNHFNVFAGKGVDRILLTSYERDVIRPHVFGSFRELLGATAHSPAMLFYLDNWLSVDPERGSRESSGSRDPQGDPAERQNEMSQRPRRFGFNPARGRQPRGPEDPAPRPQNLRRTGLNENYARELMELHTLGVDGGYTQQDIVQVARVFTGWTIDQPRRGAEFRFDARLHDNREKVVLGHTIKGQGEAEGERVLDTLATHPSTARFISTKLARRFVSDDPPASVVDRASRRFRETNGNLREVVRTILMSPEFFAPDAYRAKVKSPFEFVVSAIRATAAEVGQATSLARTLRELGMPLYMSQPPTGYPDKADAWVNTGALVARMNFAVALAGNQLAGVSLDPNAYNRRAGTSPTLERLVDDWLRGDASPATLETMATAPGVEQLVALAIGSPEFQKR